MSTKRILLETSTGKLSLAQGTTTIGRSRSCGIRLEDLSASRNHAMLSRDGDRVTVRDLESSNGTFLNGERLDREVELGHGDVITIGESELRLAVEDEVAEPGSQTVVAAGDLSTQYVPRPLAPPPAAPRPVPPPLLAPNPIIPGEKPESAELLPSIEDIERQLAVQERSASPPKPRSGTARIQPAGFFRRLLAQLVDGALVMGVALGASFLGGGPLEPTGGMVMSIAALLLGVAFHVGGWTMGGASPGKKLLGLVVCDDQGRVGLSFGRALLRYVGYLVSSIPLGAGYLIPLFHPRKKALHDLIAGTYVGRR